MKASALKGKTIRKVHQYRHPNPSAGPAWYIEAIEFTDGSFLRFIVLEDADGGEYEIEGIYPAREVQK